MRGRKALGLVAIIASSAVGQVHAQERIIIDDAVACPCPIQVELAYTISDLDGRAGLSRPRTLTRTRDGHVLMVPSVDQGAILLFDPTGMFLRRIGRSGGGPGEYSAVIDLQPDGVAVDAATHAGSWAALLAALI